MTGYVKRRSLPHLGQYAATNDGPKAEDRVHRDHYEDENVQHHILLKHLGIWVGWRWRGRGGCSSDALMNFRGDCRLDTHWTHGTTCNTHTSTHSEANIPAHYSHPPTHSDTPTPPTPQLTEILVPLSVIAVVNCGLCRYLHRDGATQGSIVELDLGMGE